MSINDTNVKADLVLLATGVKPNTEYIYNSLTMSDNYVKCDAYMNTSDPNIFAAGDIVSYPSIQNGERLSFAHYVGAQQQGSIAALNMLDKVYDSNIESTIWICSFFLDKNVG